MTNVLRVILDFVRQGNDRGFRGGFQIPAESFRVQGIVGVAVVLMVLRVRGPFGGVVAFI